MVWGSYQELLGAAASILAIVGTVVYIRSILAGDTKPHLYTWIVFSVITSIAFFAQLTDNAGPGAWMMGVTALACTLTALLAIRYGEKSRTRSDKLSLAAALMAIVPWVLTDDPLISVILISLIDGVAMIPTIRKSWAAPYSENLPTYWIANVKGVLALCALANFTVVTALYMISIICVNTVLISVCLYRRRLIEKEA